jgi:hypothetical protein
MALSMLVVMETTRHFPAYDFGFEQGKFEQGNYPAGSLVDSDKNIHANLTQV